jgi:hypothetical protein
MLHPRKQKGMTLIGWLCMMALIGFFAILVIKMWPIYFENFGVKRAVAKLPTVPEISTMTDAQIWRVVEKQFTVDGVNNAKKDNFELERTEEGNLIARIKYEVRVNILFNVDAVVWFKEEAVLPQK